VHQIVNSCSPQDRTAVFWCRGNCCSCLIIVIVPSSPFLLALPNASSTRQWKLHHHRRQVMEHSHSPIYHLWRHGMSCDTKAHRTRRGEGSEVGATHATPRPVRRALGSWGLPARSGALSMLLLHPKCSLTGLIFCAVAAHFVPMLPRAL
jgi:hypothetical protein